jgi:hypothetical protein
MEIKVNFLDKLRLEDKFDVFTVVADQPIRYKGDGSAAGPFDYFLARHHRLIDSCRKLHRGHRFCCRNVFWCLIVANFLP